jgi:hypothetical protein
LSGDFAVLQASIFDGLSLDPFALLDIAGPLPKQASAFVEGDAVVGA